MHVKPSQSVGIIVPFAESNNPISFAVYAPRNPSSLGIRRSGYSVGEYASFLVIAQNRTYIISSQIVIVRDWHFFSSLKIRQPAAVVRPVSFQAPRQQGWPGRRR